MNDRLTQSEIYDFSAGKRARMWTFLKYLGAFILACGAVYFYMQAFGCAPSLERSRATAGHAEFISESWYGNQR